MSESLNLDLTPTNLLPKKRTARSKDWSLHRMEGERTQQPDTRKKNNQEEDQRDIQMGTFFLESW